MPWPITRVIRDGRGIVPGDLVIAAACDRGLRRIRNTWGRELVATTRAHPPSQDPARTAAFTGMVAFEQASGFAFRSSGQPIGASGGSRSGSWRARSWSRTTGPAERIGLCSVGAAAHIVCQVAVWQGREVTAFTRSGDEAAQAFARSLGPARAGPSDAPPPPPLDAAIPFAPVGALVPLALRAVRKGSMKNLGAGLAPQ